MSSRTKKKPGATSDMITPLASSVADIDGGLQSIFIGGSQVNALRNAAYCGFLGCIEAHFKATIAPRQEV